MRNGLDGRFLAELDDLLAPADAQAGAFPGEPGTRQPVHTVYVPADRYRAGTPAAWGTQALALLERHGPTPAEFARATGLSPALAGEVLPRVRAKLSTQPIEDLRVDFEDGYPDHPDDEEDAAATAAGRALAGSPPTDLSTGSAATDLPSTRSAATDLPPTRSTPADPPSTRSAATDLPPTGSTSTGAPLLVGIRIKSLQAATRRRGLRTLDLVVRAAVEAGGLPPRFVVTLPKVAHVAEMTAAVRIGERLEAVHGLAAGAVRFEVQIELPQAVVGPDGAATVARLVHAAEGRCEGLHYGTYDFSAAAGVVAVEQSLEHPLADHAKAVMQLAAAQTGVRVSDGSTNVVPEGSPEAVRQAWQLHARLVDRSLRRALFQGWDLHPGHLVTRYAATYAFYRRQLEPSCARLQHYVARRSGGVMDEPATAVALAGVLLRALDCGACDDGEVAAAGGPGRGDLLQLARRSG